jgi:zinc transport system substrate-binding protein
MFLCVSCGTGTGVSDNPVISVSILPQKYFVERLAGDRVAINVMIPPGASPATYEPTVSQLSELDQSILYLRMGHVGFELAWMEKIRSVNPAMKIVDLSKEVDLIHEDEEQDHDHMHGHVHGGIDPHIWMSAQNVKIFSRNILDELLLLFPEESEVLKARYRQWENELDSLQLILAATLDGLEERSFMIFHPALSYYARDFDLEQYPIEIGGKEPSPAHMKRMADLGKEKNIKTIFIQQQFETRNAEVLAGEIGAEIVQINPLEQDWFHQMLYIAEKLSR